jgi:type II secretory pathway component GspD/PulD (secretin)
MIGCCNFVIYSKDLVSILRYRLLKLLFGWFLFLFCLTPSLWAQDKFVSLDFKSADIQDVLRVLANQEGVNIIIDNAVSGIITIQLNHVTFQQALDLITANNDLACTRTGNIYRVAPVDHSFLNLEFADGLLSLEAREVKLDRLIRELAQKTGANLVPAPDLQDRVTLTIHQVALTEAIQALLTHVNCMEEVVGKVSFVRKKSTPALSFTVNFQDELLSVDAKNVPIVSLCRAISEKTGVAVVPDQNLAVNISIFLQSVPVDDGLTVLCETNGLQLYQEGRARRIAKKNGVYRIIAQKNRLSVDADNVEIATVLHEISRQTGVNIALDRDIRGNIDAHFQNLDLAQGLAMLVENQGWVVYKQANQYYVRVNQNQNKNIRIGYNPDSRLFDLDVQNAQMVTVIGEMARRADLNVVVLAQVNANISNIRLQKVKFNEALDFLFKGTIFYYKVIDDVYLIGDVMQIRPENKDFAEVKVYPVKFLKADQLLNSLPAILPRQNFTLMAEKNSLILTAPQSVHELFTGYLAQVDIADIEDRTEVIKVKYLKAEDMLKLIPAALPKSDLIVVKEANAIAVTGPQNVVNQVKNYIEKLDQINPMIVFDITVIQISGSNGFTWDAPIGTITLSDGRELKVTPAEYGISLNKPGANTSDSLVKLTALISKGQAKVIANPTISTLNGCQASFNVTTKYSYTVPTTVSDEGKTITESVKTYDSGLYFTIVPWVSMNKQITMEIKPKISEFGDSPEGSTLPSTTERSSETTVRVNDGQTIIISGLKNHRKQVSTSKIPVLGEIPLLGNLFKNKTVSEVQDEFVLIIKASLVFDDAGREAMNRQFQEKMGPEVSEELGPESGEGKKKDFQE